MRGRARIGELITAQLDAVAEIVDAVKRLASDLHPAPSTPSLARFTVRWHFTEAQVQELRGLLRQWTNRAPQHPVWSEQLNRCPSAKSVLAELQQRLSALPASDSA